MKRNRIIAAALAAFMALQLAPGIFAEQPEASGSAPDFTAEGYYEFQDAASALTDELFFGIWNNGLGEWTTKGKLNYGYSDELDRVEECVKGGRYEDAKSELLEYYRTRSGGSIPETQTSTSYPLDLIIDGIYTNRVSFLTKDLVIPTEYEWIEIDVTDFLNLIRDGFATLCLHARKKWAEPIRIASKESDYAPYIDAVINGKAVRLDILRDTYIRAQDYENQVYGGEKEILIHDSGNPIDSDYSMGFIQINTSEIAETDIITSAKLRIYAKTDGAEPAEMMIFRDNREFNENADSFASMKSHLTIVSWQGIEGGTNWDWPEGYYGEFEYHFNRFYFLDDFVRMYRKTENEYYAYHALRLMLDFLQDQNVGYPRSLEEPIRALSWQTTFFHLLESKYMTPAAATALLKYFWESQEYLRTTFAVGSNWGTAQTKTFLKGCAAFPEFSDCPLWLKTIRSRVENDIAPLILDDGAYIENSNSYASGTLQYILGFFKDAKATGLEFSDAFTKKTRLFTKYMMDCANRNGASVEWGDGGAVDVRSYIRDLAEVFGDQEFLYFGTDGARGTLPSWTSANYPVGRRTFLRTGWKSSDTFLYINNYKGNIHGHSDALHIYLDAYGESMLSDTGKLSYDVENDEIAIWQTYNTEAHNSVSVNHAPQRNTDYGETNALAVTDYTDFYEGYTDSNENVRHERSILFIKPNYFIVSDLLTPSDDSTVNDYRQTWHTPYGANLTIDSGSKAARTNYNNRANLQIIPADPELLEAEIKMGWSWGLTGNSGARVPYLSYGQNKPGQVSYDTVLFPEKLDAKDSVTVKRLDTGSDKTEVTALELNINHKKAYYMLSHRVTGESRSFGDGNSFDGKMAYFEKNSYGELSTVSVADGKRLVADGREIIRSGKQIASLAMSYEGAALYLSSDDPKVNAAVYVPEGCERIYLNGKEIMPVLAGSYAYVGDDEVSPPSELTQTAEKTTARFSAAEWKKYITLREKTELLYTLHVAEGTEAMGGADYAGQLGMPHENGGSVLVTPDYTVRFSKPVRLENRYELTGSCEYITAAGSRADIPVCTAGEAETLLQTSPVVRVGNDFYLRYNLAGYTFQVSEGSVHTPLEPPQRPDNDRPGGGNSGGSMGGGSPGGAGPGTTEPGGEQSGAQPEIHFADTAGHWAEESILRMAKQGVINGVSDTSFEPDRSITRAELTAILLRASGKKVIPFAGCFADVSEKAWYADVMESAKQYGIIAGDGERARPDDAVTREEMVKILVSAMEKLFGRPPEGSGTLAFADREQISAWAYPYVCAAVKEGLISGDGELRFNPKNNCTRAEAAAATDRMYQKIVNS